MARLSGAAGAVVVALALLAGCGADDAATSSQAEQPHAGEPTTGATASTAAATTGPPASSPTPTGAGDPTATAFCAAVAAADTAWAGAPRLDAEPSEAQTSARARFAESYAPVLAELARSAPAELSGQVATLVRLAGAAARDGDAVLLDSGEHAAADTAVDDYLLARCGYPALSVYAVDFEFLQLPESLLAGPRAISLANDGQELHHLVLLRLDDEVQDPVEDLVALPVPEILAGGEVLVEILVPPGRSNTSLVTLTAGRYLAVCFVPKGSKGRELGQGEGHHSEGMFAELVVT